MSDKVSQLAWCLQLARETARQTMLSTLQTCELMEYMQHMNRTVHGGMSRQLDDMIYDCKMTADMSRQYINVYDMLIEDLPNTSAKLSLKEIGESRAANIIRSIEERNAKRNEKD
ncbi:MAG: hypothetical protein ACOVQN_00840 [Exiguobacterium sp.]|jgi:hypothetical protein